MKAQTAENSEVSSIYELKIGTKIRVKMDNEVNSRSSDVNDTFTARVVDSIIVQGVTVLPADAVIEGRIIDVRSAASAGKGGLLKIKFETLRLGNGVKRTLDAVLVTKLQPKSSKTKNTLAILGSTALGALIGAILKSNSGVFIGAGLGAGVGTGTVLFKKGKEVRIKADEKFEIELLKSVILPAEGF